MRGFQYKKTIQSLIFFTDESGHQNKMKALKLIWLSDRLHLRRYSRTITGDVYFALPFGPVASTTRDILERYGLGDLEKKYSDKYLDVNLNDSMDYKSIGEFDINVFSNSDIEVMNLIKENYFQFNHFELSELSHCFPEWKQYESAFKRELISRERIQTMDLFEDFEDNSKLFIGNNELTEASRELFEQNHSVLSCF